MKRRKVTFTDKALKALKPNPKGPKDVYDAHFSGGSFIVRVYPSGRKSFSVVYMSRGKRRSATLGSYPDVSLSDARIAARKTIAKVDAGDDPVHEKRKRQELPTLREYYEHSFRPAFVDNDKAYRASTRDAYRSVFKCHILKSGMADLRLDLIRRSDVLKLASGMANSNYAKQSIEGVISGLKACIREAMDDHPELTVNPVFDVHRTYSQAPTMKTGPEPLSMEQTIAFLAKARELYPAHYPLFLTAVQTGMRSGEMKALKWTDLDFEARAIHVQRNFSHGQMNPPKTARGKRSVDMSRTLASCLQAYKSRLRQDWLKKDQSMPEWVFPSAKGNILCTELKRKPFKRVLREADLPNIRFHSLRDTFASLLLMAGEPVAYVSAQLGHSNPTITFASYAKWIPGVNREAVEALPS